MGDAKQRGVLKSILSPVLQLFHPGKQEGEEGKSGSKASKAVQVSAAGRSALVEYALKNS